MKNNLDKITKLAKETNNNVPMDIQRWFAIAWAREIPSLLPFPLGKSLNLGAGYRHIGDSEPLDKEHGWDADKQMIPYSDCTIAGIHANGFFEHVANVPKVLAECQRVLIPGGVLNIVVPHGLSDLWAEDCDHKTRIVEDTFRNIFANPYYNAGKGNNWQLRIHAQFIMGVVWRNLALFTQFVKENYCQHIYRANDPNCVICGEAQ